MARQKRKIKKSKSRTYICDKCRHEFHGVPIRGEDRFGNVLTLCPKCAGVNTDVKTEQD